MDDAGIAFLIRDELRKKQLVASGLPRWSRSYDDLDMPKERPLLARCL